jgi:betaine/carnitine transporter, BCCT family
MKEDSERNKEVNSCRMNPYITWVPIIFVLLLAASMTLFPDAFGTVLFDLQKIAVDDLGILMMILDLVCIIIAIYWALSKYGRIKLGDLEKPKYSNLSWGGMIFTSTMAADLIYWALFEWIYYYMDSPLGIDAGTRTVSQTRDIVSAYSLFHWGPLNWIFAILPGAIYAFMIYVKKRSKENISEACRPVLGKRVDGWVGTLIDILCVVANFMCCSIWLRVGVPIMASLASSVFGVPDTTMTQIAILIIIWLLYTVVTVIGMKAIKVISDIGMYLYIAILAIFFLFGPIRYIVESSYTSIGYVVQNYLSMSTWMDPLRLTAGDNGMGFPQNWTVFFIANCLIAISVVPFFIAKISEGRTIRNVILGGLLAGCMGTCSSFMVMSNFTIYQQMTGYKDYISMVKEGMKEAQVIVEVVKTIPISTVLIIIILVCMAFLFVTTLDAYTLVISGFTQCNRACGQETDLKGRLFSAVALYITPIAVTLVNTSLEQMKALITLTSYPMGVLLIIILIGFRRDLKKVDIDHYDPAVGIDPRIFDDEYADDAISHEAAEAH